MLNPLSIAAAYEMRALKALAEFVDAHAAEGEKEREDGEHE